MTLTPGSGDCGDDAGERGPLDGPGVAESAVAACSVEQFLRDPCLPGTDDPYTIYAELREQSAIHWCEGPRQWVILRHAEGLEHMRDPRYSRQRHRDKLIARFGADRIYEHQKLDIPYLDGEAHQRIRHHVTNAFRGIDLTGLGQFSRHYADHQLAGIPADEPFDIVSLLGSTLPVMVVSELMGVPPSEQGEIAGKVAAFVRARGLTQTEATATGGDDAFAAYRGFYAHHFLPLIEERRREPRGDLLSRLIADPQQGIALGDEQLLLIISSNFYSASVFTLRLLVGTIAWAMATHPDSYRRIRADRSLIPVALEEVLRWDPPAQALNSSTALEDIVIDGKRIAAGDSVTVLVGAANRDPRVFEAPDELRIERSPNPHLSFAPGLHQCLGLHLARLEGAAVLAALCDRFETLNWRREGSRRLIGDRFRGFDRLELIG